MRNQVFFPQGRSFLATEIATHSFEDCDDFSVVWKQGDLLREAPRGLWASVSVLFVVLGLFAINDMSAKVIFVLLGIISAIALSTKLGITIHDGMRLERSTFLGGVLIGVQSIDLPADCLFRVRKAKEIDGTSWYIVIAADTFVEEVLPITSNGDYGPVVEEMNRALIHSRKRSKVLGTKVVS